MNADRDPENLRILRARAEKKLKERMGRLQKLSTLDIRELVHELGTHQIELEMQNEELRRAQEELEESRDRYAELYDFAPIGHFTFDTNGVIREVNLTGAKLLGMERGLLVNKPFAGFIAERADKEIFYNHCREVLKEQNKSACELLLENKADTVFFARLESIAVRDRGENAVSLRTAMSDITERKLAEEERDRITLDHLAALSNIKTLSGLLPICMHCKKIRDDQGYWYQLESYISTHSETEFSHGVCPECTKKLYSGYLKTENEK